MTKTLLTLAAITTGFCTAVRAEDAPKALSASLDVTYVSDYIFRGREIAGSSIQPSLELSYGEFYAGAWYSDDIDDSDKPSETDLYFGYTYAINEVFSVDVGLTRYIYGDAGHLDSTEPYVGVTSSVPVFGNFSVSPSVYAHYDFDNDETTVIASVGGSVPIPKLGIALDLTALIGNVQRTQGLSDYTYWGVGAAIPYRLTDAAKLTAAVNYTSVDTNNLSDSPDQDQVVFSVGVAVGF